MSNLVSDASGVNGTVSGTIISCSAAGVPTSLLIPIRPWNKPDKRGDGAGKAPGVPDPGWPDGSGRWLGLEGWEKGLPIGRLLNADSAGANCGLRLGVPSEREPRLNFFAFDLDLNPGTEQHRAAILSALQAHCTTPMPYRSTWPYRGLVLLNVEGFDAGRDHNWLAMHNGQEIGKIQLLTEGRQSVIGGTHYSGNAIAWHVNGDERVWRSPPITDVGIPSFASFDELRETLENCFQDLKALGYEFPLSSTGSSGNGAVLADQEKAPPELTVSILADALDRMPNPKRVDYGKYVEISFAAGGATLGIEAHHGKLSQGDEDKLTNAFAGWVARWEGGSSEHAVEAARNEWIKNWRTKAERVGWRNLIKHASDLGLDDLPDFAAEEAARASERAQNEFTAELRQEPRVSDFGFRVNYAPGNFGDWYISNARGEVAGFGEFATEDEAWEAVHEHERQRELAAKLDKLFADPGSFTGDEFSPAEGTALRTLTVLTPDQCEDAAPRPYVLKGIIGQGDVMLLTARPGAGKSVLGPYIGYAAAQGWEGLFNRRLRQGKVLYISAEDGAGMKVRVRALRKMYGNAPDFHLIPHAVNLMTADSEQIRELVGLIATLKPVLIVIDTLARAFPGIKENQGDNEGMGRVVTVARGFAKCAGGNGSAVMIMHHMPHDFDRSRGNTVLAADADVEGIIHGSKAEPRVISLLKNRNGPSDISLTFGVRTVDLGVDEDGDPICAVIGEEVDKATVAAMDTAKEITGRNRLALDALREAVEDEGAPLPTGKGFPPSGIGAPVKLWQERFYAKLMDKLGEDKEKARKRKGMAFGRAVDVLGERVAISGEWAWLTNQPGAEFTFEEKPQG